MLGHTVRVKSEEPILLLLVRADVDECCRPFKAVCVLELFQEDLHGLTVWRVLCDQVQTFGILDIRRRLVCVETV